MKSHTLHHHTTGIIFFVFIFVITASSQSAFAQVQASTSTTVTTPTLQVNSASIYILLNNIRRYDLNSGVENVEKISTLSDDTDALRKTGIEAIERRKSVITRKQAQIDRSKLNNIKNQVDGLSAKAISSLNGLEFTIKREKDITKLKQAIDKINADYRVFTVFVPRVDFVVINELVGSIRDGVTNRIITTNVKHRIDSVTDQTLQTELNTLYTSMQNDLSNGRKTKDNAFSLFIFVTPHNYSEKKGDLMAAAVEYTKATDYFVNAGITLSKILTKLGTS